MFFLSYGHQNSWHKNWKLPIREQFRTDTSQVWIISSKLIIIFMEEEKLSSIDFREMALKWTTKAEVYKVLTTTGGIYLPPVDQINWDSIRDILSEEKLVSLYLTREYVEWSKIKIIELPHIEGLRIPDQLEFGSKHWAFNKYMPEYEYEKYPSRKWIWNVSEFLMYHLSKVNSLIQDRFK